MKNYHLAWKAATIAAVMFFQSICLPAKAQWATVNDASKTSSTLTWVAIGLGSAVIIGCVILLIAKANKKKKIQVKDVGYYQAIPERNIFKINNSLDLEKNTSRNVMTLPNRYSGFIMNQINFGLTNITDVQTFYPILGDKWNRNNEFQGLSIKFRKINIIEYQRDKYITGTNITDKDNPMKLIHYY